MPESLISKLAADDAHRCERRQWLTGEALTDAAGTVKLDWLSETGWMTQRLRQLCGPAFRFDVIGLGSIQLGSQEQEMLNTTETDGVCREIEFSLETEPLLFAQVVLTRRTAGRIKWLQSNEIRPLGDELAARSDVERSDFRFSLIDCEDPLYVRSLHRSAESADALWLRQSVFSIGDSLLLVNEVFLPALWRVAT